MTKFEHWKEQLTMEDMGDHLAKIDMGYFNSDKM